MFWASRVFAVMTLWISAAFLICVITHWYWCNVVVQFRMNNAIINLWLCKYFVWNVRLFRADFLFSERQLRPRTFSVCLKINIETGTDVTTKRTSFSALCKITKLDGYFWISTTLHRFVQDLTLTDVDSLCVLTKCFVIYISTRGKRLILLLLLFYWPGYLMVYLASFPYIYNFTQFNEFNGLDWSLLVKHLVIKDIHNHT